VTQSNAIAGVHTVILREFADDRGSVLHMLRIDSPDFKSFGECYFSEIVPGAVKAWKMHQKQTQNLAVPVGRIRLVIYDDRIESSTKGNLQILELGRPECYVRVVIPPGIWYGFACLGNTPALLANCADIPHDPLESSSKDITDQSIPYIWKQNSID
jgi:dTDP-4-dehydrorhamnose 3,5-epimerase